MGLLPAGEEAEAPSAPAHTPPLPASSVGGAASGGGSAPPPAGSTLQIVHFNDVYEIAQRTTEPVGGAPRFAHLVHRLCGGGGVDTHGGEDTHGGGDTHLAASPRVVFFSGDALSPSLMSTITKGRHMVPVLNSLRIAAACLGNHDLDFGEDSFETLALACDFPWLVSNARVKATGRPLGGATRETAVVTADPWRIGVLGLIEEEWLATLSTVSASAVTFEPYVDAAARLVPGLRADGCNLIVALTHMRMPNDGRLAAAAPRLGIDLILGGHDHDYRVELGGACPVVKSGSDFRTLSVIRVGAGGGGSATTSGGGGGGGGPSSGGVVGAAPPFVATAVAGGAGAAPVATGNGLTAAASTAAATATPLPVGVLVGSVERGPLSFDVTKWEVRGEHGCGGGGRSDRW